MRNRTIWLANMALLSACAAGQAIPNRPQSVETFNRTLEDATRRMDNAAIVALWAEDGISLLPETKPIIGRAEIASFMERITASIKGARMQEFTLNCSNVVTSGDWASEWCTEHQIVAFMDGKPSFDGHGQMLLVLHRAKDGKWRLEREMWNQAARN